MRRERFSWIVGRVCLFYERRFPKDEAMDLWAEKVKGIPDDAAGYIEAHITDNETFPRNFPAAMWALFHSWQQANPDKTAERTYFECPDCFEGLIWAAKRKEGTGPLYSAIFRCCRCRQNHVQAYPKAFKDELTKKGWKIRIHEGPSEIPPAEARAKTMQHLNRMGINYPW